MQCTLAAINRNKCEPGMPQEFNIDDDLDATFVTRVRPQIERLAEAAEDVVLDLSKVDFIDSSGLGALVFLHRRLVAKGHKLKIMGLKGQPLQLFTNLHLVPVFCE
jgi:anti-sigma B factor antagonist